MKVRKKEVNMKKVVSVLLITGLISPVMCNVAEASGNS